MSVTFEQVFQFYRHCAYQGTTPSEAYPLEYQC